VAPPTLQVLCARLISSLDKCPASLSGLPNELLQLILRQAQHRINYEDVIAMAGPTLESLPLSDAVGVGPSWASYLRECPLETIDLANCDCLEARNIPPHPASLMPPGTVARDTQLSCGYSSLTLDLSLHRRRTNSWSASFTLITRSLPRSAKASTHSASRIVAG
jgi:hypothetical protein